MNVNEVITKLKVMLGAETETVEEVQLEAETTEETTEVKMAEAELIDGTIVYTEGELAPGAILMVKPAEGEEPVMAPQGIHETTDGFLVEVGEAGEIISIEEKAAEATEEVVEEEMAEEDKKEKSYDMSAEELIEAIAEMMKPQAEELKKLKEELSTLQERFNQVADEPAAPRVRNTFSQEAAAAKNRAEARFERLMKIRKGDI